MHHQVVEVTGGVDTHAEFHVAAAVDQTGRVLGTESFPANRPGYQQLLERLTRWGPVARVGVEGTGSYGVGVCRLLAERDVTVVEVNRPNRQNRRRRGKSDAVDAVAAACAALNGDASASPKTADGPVESIRVLRVARRSAVKACTQCANQIHALVINAADDLRDRLQPLRFDELVETCARFRPGMLSDPTEATKAALRSLGRRHLELTAEINTLDESLLALCAEVNPALLGARGVGSEVAAALLVAAGDNPHRLRSQASFAAFCGASPIEASSGKIVRHRLNRGGNRSANNALWRIVMVRLSSCDRTRAYAKKRTEEGKTSREIMRCLKRYVAREVYQLLVDPPDLPDTASFRAARTAAGISLKDAADQLGQTSAMTLSRLERGIRHDTELAFRYHQWLAHNTAA